MTLPTLPPTFQDTRASLHQLAFFAVAPSRYRSVGRMGLAATSGGFGTPRFEGQVARIEGDLLVYEKGDAVAVQTITTIRAAAEFFGIPYEVDWFSDFHDPLTPAEPDSQLNVDPEATHALGELYAFAFEVLDKLRSEGDAADDVTEVQLWPEHFDSATELGDADAGRRASFGVSPGDAEHPWPYAYVAAWSPVDRRNRFWNDESFNGSSLPYSELAGARDPAAAALGFFLEGYRVLRSG